MDQTLKAFVERQNIARFIEQIKTEGDPVKRKLLATLLDEEKAKQSNGETPSVDFGLASAMLGATLDVKVGECADSSKQEAGRSFIGAKGTPENGSGNETGSYTPVDLIEISGVIKWFDASKGYGFVVPDGDLPDVFLHVTSLRRDGFKTACEGAASSARCSTGRTVCRRSASSAWTRRRRCSRRRR